MRGEPRPATLRVPHTKALYGRWLLFRRLVLRHRATIAIGPDQTRRCALSSPIAARYYFIVP
jgi:hypothetical protein